MKTFTIKSPRVKETTEEVVAEYHHRSQQLTLNDQGEWEVSAREIPFTLKTTKRVSKLGVMIVGIGGSNGTTLIGGILANRENIAWQTRRGLQHPNYYGSYTQSSCIDLGGGHYVPFKDLISMVDPNHIVFSGWDLNDKNLADAMREAKVLEPTLIDQLVPFMQALTPLPGVFIPDYIANNQSPNINHCLTGTLSTMLGKLRENIREFKEKHQLDKVIVFWSGNTERSITLTQGIHDTPEHLLKAIENDSPLISPSTLYAVAAVLEGCSYINGSPQNTFVPGLIPLAEEKGVTLAGDDLKTGQTRYKSVIVDFLISVGIKPMSIVSYNHLGNNDGKNLSENSQLKSKEISKLSVIEDAILSNPLLYAPNERPDHTVVIKYVPYVGDSKRAIDEYISEIFLGHQSIISVYNVCEDALLAAPIMLDLILLTELFERIRWKGPEQDHFARFPTLNPFLSLFFKAPRYSTHRSHPVNVLYKQRMAIENLVRICVGLAPEDFLYF